MNFITSQEKHINKVYKELLDSNSMSEETQKHWKPVATRSGMMYGFCKVHKKNVLMASFHFRRILSAFKTPIYKLAKLLLPILESLTVYKYTVKHSFDFVSEIFYQDSSNFMGSLYINFLLTSPLKKPSKFFLTIISKTRTLFRVWKKVNLKIFYL